MKRFCCAGILLLGLAPIAFAADLPRLHADGPKVVDDKGKTVVLGGMNLGGWLVEEMWMMPIATKPPGGSGMKEIKDHVTLWNAVEKHLGKAEMVRVRNSLRATWITDDDFERIHKAGMNCVRLPFTYDLLEEPGGFDVLDKAIDMARKHGLYTIVDLHGTPGRQSKDHHTGEADVDRLFQDPAMVAATEKIWKTIAERYKGRDDVAAYDLMNEPMGASNAETLYLVQDRIFRAVRSVDPDHIVIIEDGYKGMNTFPRADLAGWSNVMYSRHHYVFDAKSAAEQTKKGDEFLDSVKKLQETRPVPFLIGEYQFEPWGKPETHGHFAAEADRAGLCWTVWTYKTAHTDGSGGMWGWIHPKGPFDPIDPFRDSADTMMAKIAALKTSRMAENTAMTQAFKNRGSAR